jgi:hypothetical protein
MDWDFAVLECSVLKFVLAMPNFIACVPALYIMIAAISLSAITANATTAQVDINLSSADHDRLSDATLSMMR